MQNGIESINYEQSVNITTETSFMEFDRGYQSGKRRTIAKVLRIVNQMEMDAYDKGIVDYAKACAHLREAIYDL